VNRGAADLKSVKPPCLDEGVKTYHVYERGKAYLHLGDLIEVHERVLASGALAKSAGGELTHMSLLNVSYTSVDGVQGLEVML